MDEEKEKTTWYSHNGFYLWACVKFCVYLTAFFFLITSKFGQSELVEPFTATIAVMASKILNIFGMQTNVEGTKVISVTFWIQIVNVCNGAYETATITAAMLAAPRSWMQRTLGITVAFILIYILSVIRAASLFAIGSWSQEWFKIAHLYIWQMIIIMGTLAILMVWALGTQPPDRKDE